MRPLSSEPCSPAFPFQEQGQHQERIPGHEVNCPALPVLVEFGPGFSLGRPLKPAIHSLLYPEKEETG